MSKSKNKKLYLGCFLFVLFFLAFLLGSFLFVNYKLTQSSEKVSKSLEEQEKIDEEPEVEEDIEIIQIDEDENEVDNGNPGFPQPDKYPNAIEVEELEETVWIPTWDYYAGLSSLRAKNEKFSSISPVWYSVNTDGTLVDRRNSHWGEIVSSAGNAKIIPSIAISDAEILHGILSNDISYTLHINSILTEVLQNNYDGIDIDYEMIYAKDTETFRSFIEDLAARLHQEDKTLSVAVLSQWGDEVRYSSLPETRSVQDYEWVGSVADEVRIMTYDYTSSGSVEPGPIAPISWVENVISYATEKIDREKIWMGVHLYGYQWNNLGGVKATTFSQQPDFEAIADYKYLHDESYAEGVATYTCGTGLTCTHFFQDEKGIESRKKLAAKYGIKGLAYWRLGGEGELIK